MAMEVEELEIPQFLENSSEDEIHEKMLGNLPEDIDKTEGGFPWDFTRPTAIELSELKEYVLVELLKSMFPATCEESYLLDLHAATRGLNRKESISSIGQVQVTATAGTVIPLGYGFSTEADEDGNTINFISTEEVTVDSEGKAVIEIEAEDGGVSGNVGANMIVLSSGDESGEIIDSITSITNPSPTKGGIDEEDDDTFRERIVEYDRSLENSYIGNIADYKRWALSIAGVGAVTVIPAQDDSGVVTLVILGQDGQPASQDILDEVYDYIMSPDDEERRLAPVNAKLAVTIPDIITVGVSAIIFYKNTDFNNVSATITKNIRNYLTGDAISDGTIRLSKIRDIIYDTEGVYDYENVFLSLDGENVSGNISLEHSEMPVAGQINLLEGD